MKKTIILVCVFVALFVGCKCSQSAELDAYKAYYEATENLLDTLENHYNWVDAFDPYEYYDAITELKKYK